MVITIIVMIPMMMRADVHMYTRHANSHVSTRRHNDGTHRRESEQSHKKRFHRKSPPQSDMRKTASSWDSSSAIQLPYLSLDNSDRYLNPRPGLVIH